MLYIIHKDILKYLKGNKRMKNAELRDMQKNLVEGWFDDYCVLDFKSVVTFRALYDNFIGYCDYLHIQILSRKMFSILLREHLNSHILDGVIQVKPLVNNVYKGIGFVCNREYK